MVRRSVLAAAPAALAACAVGPDPVAPALESPTKFQSGAPDVAGGLNGRPWWEGFDDETLGLIVTDVLEGNLGVAASIAALAEIGALEDAARSDLFPTLDGFADGQYARDLTGDTRGDDALEFEAGGLFSFTPDIFGRNRRRVQEAIARFEAAEFDVIDARRLAAQAAALQYIDYKRAGARLALLETSLDLQRRTLEIVRSRFNAGISPALDVDRAAADLERTSADRGDFEAGQRSARYAIAVLVGVAPGDYNFDTAGLDEVPTFIAGPDVAAPAALLRNRPDVRRAEEILVAELAAIGAEEADLYPSLNLPGQISAGSADLLTSGVNQASLALSALIDIPLFDFGRRRAEVRAQRARAEGALVAWRGAILGALADVDNALVQIEADQFRLARLQSAVESSENAYRQLDALYREGLASFIDVLDAQRTLIASREAVIDTRADLASDFVLLYAALGVAPERKGSGDGAGEGALTPDL